jgi:hypothetical protein
VADWRPALLRKETLCEVEARIKLDPESIALRFERGRRRVARGLHPNPVDSDHPFRCPGGPFYGRAR